MRNMVSLLAVIGFCLVSISGAAAQGAHPVRLVFDQAHGEPPPPEPMEAMAGKLGLEMKISARPIDAEALAGARILYLRAPSEPFTAAETESIVAFVKSGGSLFLVLDEERRQSLEKTGVNNLISPFGIRLTADTEYLHNCGGIARAGEIHKADRELPFSGGRAVEGGTPFAFQLDKDGKPAQPFGVYKRLDNGARIVVLGEGMASLFLGDPAGERLTGVPRDPNRTTYWGKDSALFMEEVLMWLSAPVRNEKSTKADLEAVMKTLARAWNEGDARRAADCFTEDAVYIEPPDKQIYRGREALYRFFGGDAGRAGQMTMQWHHLALDEESQIGFGEFTFTYGSTVHGVAVVRLREGKIANWREYWYESDLPWDQFIRANPF